VDYLLKPFSQQRFDVALARARNVLNQAQPEVQQLLVYAGQRPARILIRDRNQVHVIAVEKIEFVQAQDDYISIRSAGRDFLKTQSLGELAAQLDPMQFVRIHRSYLLNVEYLQGLERATKDNFAAVLRNGQRIPVSRAGYERLGELINGL